MPRTRNVAIVGANKEGLALLPVLERDPSAQVRLVADPNPDALVFKLDALGYRLASKYRVRVAQGLEALTEERVDLVIDASRDPATAAEIRARKPPGATVMSALSARLLWGTRDPGAGPADRSAERQSALLTGLGEIIGALNLTTNQEELLALVLSVAIESTGADRGSLLLLDPEEQVLRARVAEGIPPEVIPSIRVPLGEGISGKVAKEGKPLHISGPANPALTGAHHVREDVAAALCVPLRAPSAGGGDGEVVGVLNVHHRTDPDAFSDADLAFLLRLASLEAQIISRSQEFARLRGVAERFDTYKELRERLDGDGTLHDRLDAVCRLAAGRLPGGTCTIYRYDPDVETLVVEGTSRTGASAPWGRGARTSPGQGIEGAVARDGRERRLVDPESGSVVLASPLVARGSLEGVVVLTAAEGGHGPALDLVREMKPLVADALRRERERAAATGKVTKLAAIAEAGLAILGADDPEALAHVVAASAAMVLEADSAVVRLRDEAGRLPVTGAYGLPEESSARRERLALEKPLAGRAGRERRPVREGNWLVCPLLFGGRLAGTIAVGDKVADDPFRPGPFGLGDEEILGRLAAYVEQALKERLTRTRTPPAPAPAAARAAVQPPVSPRPTPSAQPGASALPGAPSSSPAGQQEGAPVQHGARYLSKRLTDELARSRRSGRHVAVIVARLEPEARFAAQSAPIEPIVADLQALFRSVLRVYDEVVRVGPARVAVLLPDTEDGARTVADRLAEAVKGNGLGDAVASAGASLVVGVAQAPDDLPPGPLKDREGARALIEKASRS